MRVQVRVQKKYFFEFKFDKMIDFFSEFKALINSQYTWVPTCSAPDRAHRRRRLRGKVVRQVVRTSEAKLERKTRKQRQPLSKSGFVVCAAAPLLSRDMTIKMKKSILRDNAINTQNLIRKKNSSLNNSGMANPIVKILITVGYYELLS